MVNKVSHKDEYVFEQRFHSPLNCSKTRKRGERKRGNICNVTTAQWMPNLNIFL